MRVDALQPIVVGDALHDLGIGVEIASTTHHLPVAFRTDEPLIDLLSCDEFWHLSAVEVESYVV